MENVKKLYFLENVENIMNGEREKVIDKLQEIQESQKFMEDIYKSGFYDCLKFLGVIGEDNCFNWESPVFQEIYKEIKMDGLREMVNIYYIKDGE